MQVTFAEQLGAAKDETQEDDGVPSQNKAKKLALNLQCHTGSQNHLTPPDLANWPQNLSHVQVTFAEQLGAAKHEAQEDDGVSSKNEAKKLAFYLYWNVKP